MSSVVKVPTINPYKPGLLLRQNHRPRRPEILWPSDFPSCGLKSLNLLSCEAAPPASPYLSWLLLSFSLPAPASHPNPLNQIYTPASASPSQPIWKNLVSSRRSPLSPRRPLSPQRSLPLPLDPDAATTGADAAAAVLLLLSPRIVACQVAQRRRLTGQGTGGARRSRAAPRCRACAPVVVVSGHGAARPAQPVATALAVPELPPSSAPASSCATGNPSCMCYKSPTTVAAATRS